MNAPVAPARWAALDALRGATMLAMILVNNPGRWGERYQYAPLRHADWHGCTFTDLVFPTFLFVAGVAIVPAFAARAGQPPGQHTGRILRRVVSLCLLGMLLSAFPLVTFAADRPLFAPLLGVRLPGVLQRIGVCYGIGALLHLHTSPRTQRLVLLACLLLYWPLVTLVPVPGQGLPDLGSAATVLQGHVDRAVFGEHIWRRGIYDPEGLLSTVPAVATLLFGVTAGRVLAGTGSDDDKLRRLLLRGALLTAAGVVWGWFFPINKPIWTSSYAVYTAGIATTGLALCHWLFAGDRHRAWLLPLQVYGRNALLVFVGSGLLARITGSLVTVAAGDGRISLQEWIYTRLLPSEAAPAFASLLYALLWVGGWYVVLYLLWRRRWTWKV